MEYDCGKHALNFRFDHPSIHMMVGPSGSGKTYRTSQILRLKNHIITNGEKIKNIVFCYSTWQKEYENLKQDKIVTTWINKMPSNADFKDLVIDYVEDGGSIVVIDDFMSNVSNDMDEIVRVTSRHTNTSTFLLFQSLFPTARKARQISLNVKYFHLHSNPRENAQIQYFARQLRPNSSKWIVDAYHEVTKTPFSCFLIDVTQETPDQYRFRSHYLPSEAPMKIWIEKGSHM